MFLNFRSIKSISAAWSFAEAKPSQISRSDHPQPSPNEDHKITFQDGADLTKFFQVHSSFASFNLAHPTLRVAEPLCEFGLAHGSVFPKFSNENEQFLVFWRVDGDSHSISWLSQGGLTQNRIMCASAEGCQLHSHLPPGSGRLAAAKTAERGT